MRITITLVAALLIYNLSPAHAVVAGNLVLPAEQNSRGLVMVGTGCSGAMLSEDWVVTAGHCVPTARPDPSVTVRAAWDGTPIASDAIYQFADISALSGGTPTNPGQEFALIHLSRKMPGIRIGYRLQLYPGAMQSLLGQTLAVYGQGNSTLADANPANAGSAAPVGVGTYRSANLKVVSASGYTLVLGKNANGQITQPGDSGGPSFIWSNGTAFLAGITSSGQWNCFDAAHGMGGPRCRASIFDVQRANEIAIPAVKAAIEAILKTRWDPKQTSQPVFIQRAELALQDDSLLDVNAVGWAQAMRAATKLCYNRGFSAGHFDGHQDLAGGGYGLQCSGRGTVWRDASLGEVASTAWGFNDVNTVSWARANRAAERLCALAGQGFAGGHFTGSMGSDPAGGPVFGLVCFNANVQWFDATPADINGTQWRFNIDNLDDVSWAQAGRAAVDVCRAKGFSGGFFNGQHVPGRAGLLCQR